MDINEEKDRINKELEETLAQIERLESLLASPFAKKAPENVVAKEQEKLAAYRDTYNKLDEQLQNLQLD